MMWNDRGELFGSRRYGGHTDDSDWDYLMKVSDSQYFIDWAILNKVELTWQPYKTNVMYNAGSVKFDWDGEIINLIFYQDDEWKKLLEVVSVAVFIGAHSIFGSMMKEKPRRVAIIQNLLDTAFGEPPVGELPWDV